MAARLAIVAQDQRGVYFQATLSRGYAPLGQSPIIRVSPQPDNVHFYGALDVRTGPEVAVPAPQQTSDLTADFIRLLRLLFSTQSMRLLLDRAPWPFGPAIDLLLDHKPPLPLLSYPPP